MWKCPHCGQSEPLMFQRGHLLNCPKLPKHVPIIKKEETVDKTKLPFYGEEGWDL